MTPRRSWLQHADLRADAAIEPLRVHRSARAVFVAASHIADFSALWVAIAVVHGLATERDVGETLAFCGLLLAESLLVNQGIKRLFRRVRPTQTGDARLTVRRPRSSSFPSGHASSAFFAGVLLSSWIGWKIAPLLAVAVVIVALSRAVVRIHHPSDVVAGAAVGVALAAIVLVTPLAGLLRG